MHPAIIIGTVRSLWTRLWGRYHVPQNVFLVADELVPPLTVVIPRTYTVSKKFTIFVVVITHATVD